MSSAPREPKPVIPRRMGPGSGGGVAIERARNVRGTLARLVAYLRPYLWPVTIAVLLVVVSTVMTLAGPYLLGVAIDRFIRSGDLAGLARIAVLMAAVYVLNWLASVAQSVLMARIGQQALRNLRRDLFAHLQTLSLSYFDRHPVGELMSRLTTDIETISRLLTMNVTQVVSSFLTLGGVLVTMFALDAWLALGTLLVLPLMVWVTLWVGQRTRRAFRAQQRTLGVLNAVMEETISGQRVVQAFGQQAAALDTFDRANWDTRQAAVHAQTFALLIPPMMTVLTEADVAVVAGVGGWLALQGYTSVGTIATFAAYARTFSQPLRMLADLYNQVQAALAGAERVFEVLDTQPQVRDAPHAQPLQNIQGHVQFEHVDFAYVPGVPVLLDINLEAQPGQTIALVGPTGAGKTTIVSLLTRFYDIESGAIRIDGLDIRDVTKHSLRRQLGIVLQDTYLFADTVMENIRYGRLDATDDECVAAAQLANADQFITRLPHGYATPLSERASNLSQGQRQLLVEGRTAFVIAHRLSTIREADLVLVINEGRIIERGTHDELLAQEGFYYRLYRSQFREDERLEMRDERVAAS